MKNRKQCIGEDTTMFSDDTHMHEAIFVGSTVHLAVYARSLAPH